MFEQLGDLESRYEELGRRLNDPEIIKTFERLTAEK